MIPVINIAAIGRLLKLGVAFLVSLSLHTQTVKAQEEADPYTDEPSLFPDDVLSEGYEPETYWHTGLNNFGLTGSLRTGFWSSNRLNDKEQDIGTGSIWLKLDKRIMSGVSVYTEGYVRDQNLFGTSEEFDRIKEMYVHVRKGDWDYRVGRQIIAWGRTDRLNPTDNLTPRDFTLMSPEIDEDRFGTEAIKISRVFGMYSSLTGIWIPNFRPNELPPANVAGLQFSEVEPGGSNQYALKFDRSGSDIDWSLSYFTGFDLNADLSIVGQSGADVLVQKQYNRVKIMGTDLATIVGANRYALEVAYTRSEDESGIDPLTKNSFFHSVLGIERDFGNNLSGIMQLFYRYVEDHQDPRVLANAGQRAVASLNALANHQLDEDEYGLSVRIGKKWWNETLEGELSGSTLVRRHGSLIRPKLTYSISDHLKATVGGEYFDGGPDTLFGLQKTNRTFFSEMRYFF